MRFGSLCSGMGGIDLGLRQAGMTCCFQVEIGEYERAVLTRNFPEVSVLRDDIFTTHAKDLPPVDLIAFGFMCTDIASINRHNDDLSAPTRSGFTWRECIRVVEEAKPPYVLIENVLSLLHNGLGDVLGRLAALGYDAEWHCFPAAYAGAPHERKRMFILAYPSVESVLQAHSPTFSFRDFWQSRKDAPGGYWESAPSPDWDVPEAVGTRMDDGVPHRLVGCHGLGNAVCPPVAQIIGEWFLAAFSLPPATDHRR